MGMSCTVYGNVWDVELDIKIIIATIQCHLTTLGLAGNTRVCLYHQVVFDQRG